MDDRGNFLHNPPEHPGAPRWRQQPVAKRPMTTIPQILRFFLYEEAPSDVELDFLNVEAIPLRSGAHNWMIRPHSHPNHVQILMVTHGGGAITMDGVLWEITPPGLVIVPAGTVHEISFRPNTDGIVITVASAYVATTVEEDRRLLDATLTPMALTPAPDVLTAHGLLEVFEALLREFTWSGPARRMAIKSHFLRLLVIFLRLDNARKQTSSGPGRRHAAIVERFRAEIEEGFRVHKRLDHYLRRLGVSASRLHESCQIVAGTSPAALLHDRVVIEAKRLLVYSGVSVAEIAHRLGFEDPAYFSRFFSQRAGCSPRAYRVEALAHIR